MKKNRAKTVRISSFSNLYVMFLFSVMFEIMHTDYRAVSGYWSGDVTLINELEYNKNVQLSEQSRYEFSGTFSM